MHVMQMNLPCTETDDRIGTFKEKLRAAAKGISPAEVQFLSAPGTMVDITDEGQLARIRLAYDTFVVIVYSPHMAVAVSEMVRKAIKDTWPERDDIRVHETPMEKGNKPASFWFIRGDKKE